MKQQNKYELISDIFYCNKYGTYAHAKDLSEPGFEPWVRIRVKVITISNSILRKSHNEDFIYHGDRGILSRLVGDQPYSILKVKIKKKKYQSLLKQVHKKMPQIKKNEYLLGWPGKNYLTYGFSVLESRRINIRRVS